MQNDEHILCFHNVSDESQDIRLDSGNSLIAHANSFEDLFTNQQFHIDEHQFLKLTLAPYQIAWLKAVDYAD